MAHREVPIRQRRFAKAMRTEMPEAELRLWRHLRKPGIEGLRFRRQVPIGLYIVDFFCPSHRLVVEVDGGQHGHDGHVARDVERDAWLVERGYRVVRVWNSEVMASVNDVCGTILGAVLEERAPPPKIR